MGDLTHQPLPQEYGRKVDLFERLTKQALEVAQHRRGLGARALTGVFGTGDVPTIVVESRQSGLLLVTVDGVDDKLHLERKRFVWDEAMLAPQMKSIPS